MLGDLQAVVDEGYVVFSKYSLHEGLTVCNCDLCMSKAAELELVRTPLRHISAELLAEYTNSAHGYEEGSIANELRYFLPRYLELVALGKPPDHMGLDQCLRRLGESSYRSKWPAEEADVIDRFFDAFVTASTFHLELERWPVGWLPAFELVDALTMALTAGADVERLIQALESAPDPGAAVHLAVLRGRVLRQESGYLFRSVYLEDEEYKGAAQRLGEWLVGSSVGDRIEAAFFNVADPRLQEILSKAAW